MNVDINPAICEKCTLNDLPGAHKLFPELHRRPILILTQSPTHEENDEGAFLIGPQGKFLKRELSAVGISLEQCDATAAVRCIPANPVVGSYSTSLRPRAPSKEEIKQCSYYTKSLVQIVKPGKTDGARAILVLGQVAAKQLLSGEWKKNRRIIDSAKLGVRVFCVDHPGFFIRGGAHNINENDERLKAFRQTIRALAEFINSGAKVMTSLEYLKQQNYAVATTAEKAWFYAERLKNWAIQKSERLSVDVEDDLPDDFDETGMEATESIILSVAVCPKPGHSVMFLVDHPEAIRAERKGIVKALRWLLSDPDVHLVMHYGSSDADKLKDILRIDTPGYDYDTFTAMYMANPGRHSYGQAALVEEHAPQFAGYKWIIAPYVGPPDLELPKTAVKSNEAMYNYIKSKSTVHFSRIPARILRLYNNADADVCKRFEMQSRADVPAALARLYKDMGHLVYRMERNGPLVDRQHLNVLKDVWPVMVEKAAAKLHAVAKHKNFNPNNPAHIAWLLWDKLQIPYPNPKAKKFSTGKEVLLQVAPDFPIAGDVREYRKVAKTKNTYVDGYEKCADLNGGHLRTKWWLTGTRTGRMSSGGSKEKIKGVVNLQNIQKNTHIRNILVSDLRWRELYRFIKQCIADNYTDAELEIAVLARYGDMGVFLEFDQGQVEVRTAAQVSGDETMIADCEAGDIHSRVGHAMTGWAIELIKNDKDTRTRTKNVHFGLLFGLQPEGILRYIKGFDPHTKITLDDVRMYYNNYFERYPGVAVYIERQHKFAEIHQYVMTLYGMKRPLIINEQMEGLFDDYGQPAYWRNIAVNTPIQGTAHQTLMCGMAALVRQPDKYAILGIPQMEVHDNLVMRLALKNLVQGYWLAKELLEQEPLRTIQSDFPDIHWRVKLEVDGAAGFRFGVKVGLDNSLTLGSFLRRWYEENKKYAASLKELRTAA